MKSFIKSLGRRLFRETSVPLPLRGFSKGWNRILAQQVAQQPAASLAALHFISLGSMDSQRARHAAAEAQEKVRKEKESAEWQPEHWVLSEEEDREEQLLEQGKGLDSLQLQKVDRKSEIEAHEVLRKVRLGYRRINLPALCEIWRCGGRMQYIASNEREAGCVELLVTHWRSPGQLLRYLRTQAQALDADAGEDDLASIAIEHILICPHSTALTGFGSIRRYNLGTYLKEEDDDDDEGGPKRPKDIKPALVSKKKGEREKDAIQREVSKYKDPNKKALIEEASSSLASDEAPEGRFEGAQVTDLGTGVEE
ncbi:hypothetical protein AK812_SmicGene13341 [Symbiodinium microadriaticum]|uniref:Uncharacterized protein n=1 Tax=Symbiodinium microadriaticum TaxID=2951 RepID=A0A1Q9E8D3_SYMMI|nr:hypothetical protein AK812_SmicGene13341 [Symbiodinium microadriaticum]